MKTYNPKIPLISIHIPKCGGTSLTDILSTWFGKRLYLHYYDEKRAKMPERIATKTVFNTYKSNICIHGHFNRKRGFGVDDYYPNIDQAITFLRDPLEVQQSVFFYNHKLKNAGNLFRDGRKMEIPNDIDEFLETSKPYFRLFLPENINSENLDYYFEKYFVHVGVMEYYEKSVQILSEKLKKKFVNVPFENKSSRFVTPSNSSVQLFLEKCKFEYDLYKKACEYNK